MIRPESVVVKGPTPDPIWKHIMVYRADLALGSQWFGNRQLIPGDAPFRKWCTTKLRADVMRLIYGDLREPVLALQMFLHRLAFTMAGPYYGGPGDPTKPSALPPHAYPPEVVAAFQVLLDHVATLSGEPSTEEEAPNALRG